MRYQPDAIWDAATWAEIDPGGGRGGEARLASSGERFGPSSVMAAERPTAPSWILGRGGANPGARRDCT